MFPYISKRVAYKTLVVDWSLDWPDPKRSTVLFASIKNLVYILLSTEKVQLEKRPFFLVASEKQVKRKQAHNRTFY